MKTISTKTAIVVIVSFAGLCTALVFAASKLPKTSHWERYRIEYPEKAIQANLRKIVFAAQYHMRSNRVDEARYKDMIGTGIFLDKPIEPILGEDYSTICVTGKDTKIEVVTKDGKTISIEFDPLGTFTTGPPLIPDLELLKKTNPNR